MIIWRRPLAGATAGEVKYSQRNLYVEVLTAAIRLSFQIQRPEQKPRGICRLNFPQRPGIRVEHLCRRLQIGLHLQKDF